MIASGLRTRSLWVTHLSLVATLAIPTGVDSQQGRAQIAGSNLFSGEPLNPKIST